MSGIELGTFNEVKKLGKRPPAYDMATHAATGFCKPSIILFDTRPGTRSFTIPQGVTRIRAFVVGAGGDGFNGSFTTYGGGGGGGYSEKTYTVGSGDTFSYTVGASPSGTSSFNSEITATGGGTAYNDSSTSFPGEAGTASGGDINNNGGLGSAEISTGSDCSGGFSGNRFDAGISGNNYNDIGAPDYVSSDGSLHPPDGFGVQDGSTLPVTFRPGLVALGQLAGLGCGGLIRSRTDILSAHGGVGGGGAALSSTAGKGGPGLVGIEVLEVE